MSSPIRLALLNDFALVLAGLETLLEPFGSRIEIVEATTGAHRASPTDVTLLDAFGATDVHRRARQAIEADNHTRLALFTWNFNQADINAAFRAGAQGYLSKQLDAEGLVVAIEQIHQGVTVRSRPPNEGDTAAAGYGWPGRKEGLSERQAEIVALIAQGMSNEEISRAMFLSINTVKTYIRSAYQRMGVNTRTRALLWAQEHELS